MSLRDNIPTLIVGLLALASLWLVTQLRPSETAGIPAGDGPDYYLGPFTLISMDPQGRPQHRIEGEGMQHLPALAETHLQQPRITLYQGSRNPWAASSEHGVYSDDGERLLLGGAVHIEGQGRSGPLRLETRDLHIQPQTGHGETDQAVTLTAANGQIHATGLRADLPQQQLHLLSNVRGRYEP